MPSFLHKLLERIARLDEAPSDSVAYATWLKADGHLSLLLENAAQDELIVYAAGDCTFIHTVVVPNAKLCPIDKDDLLRWSCNPFDSIASYFTGAEQEGVRI